MAKRSLGEFEQLVLLAILRVGDGAYVVPLIREIEDQTGRNASHAAVYIALRRLEEKGLVTSRLADPTPERGGRGKRYYEVHPAAIPLLRESREALLRMWDGLELVQ
ncbi:MAG: helix-turn-helix transcriptional regulator [Gemmatimonadota bacterium]|nr:MAG: helix-turn-helix transcriptional regulator [Gemmatimonadota bacterium]